MEEIENRDVSWKILDIPVNGTITTAKNPRAAIVFVAGSGPTDRNWCSPLLPGTNGSAKLLAEEIAKRGYLTLRYDKLGSGPRVKEDLPKFAGKISMQTHVEELAGAIETAARESKTSSLIALTNSEGAIHAINYQLQVKVNPFNGFVLTGSPGRRIGEVARGQILSQARALADTERIMKLYDDAIGEYVEGKPIAIDASLPGPLKLLLRSLENPNNLPFARELWSYSFPDHMKQITESALIIIGKKDIQIDWKVDGSALESAASQNPHVSFVYPEKANHVLKHEEMPIEKLTPEYVSMHYNAEDAKLDREALDAILGWIRQLLSK